MYRVCLIVFCVCLALSTTAFVGLIPYAAWHLVGMGVAWLGAMITFPES